MNAAPTLYNEYKFLIPHEKLDYLKDLLDCVHRNSDPYPAGDVDSIYFDNLNFDSFHQCREGEQFKEKYRIRGYGDGTYGHLHQKTKNLFSVSKIKAKLKPLTILAAAAPQWQDLQADSAEDADKLNTINRHLSGFGYMFPTARIKYRRHRYRIYDYRLTLDSNIEVWSLNNVAYSANSYGIFPYNVLELKTDQERAYLPFLNLANLQQISFSKYYIGLHYLQTGEFL